MFITSGILPFRCRTADDDDTRTRGVQRPREGAPILGTTIRKITRFSATPPTLHPRNIRMYIRVQHVLRPSSNNPVLIKNETRDNNDAKRFRACTWYFSNKFIRYRARGSSHRPLYVVVTYATGVVFVLRPRGVPPPPPRQCEKKREE